MRTIGALHQSCYETPVPVEKTRNFASAFADENICYGKRVSAHLPHTQSTTYGLDLEGVFGT
jgi:hypothetical protein